MAWKVTVLFFAVTLAIGLSANPVEKDPRKKLIDTMHQYYVGQFDNLDMTKDGYFGVSRIESSLIRNHSRSGGDPGYKSDGFSTAVQIYGNHGKSMTLENVSLRFSRYPGSPPSGYRLPLTESASIRKVYNGLIVDSVKSFAKGNLAPLVKSVDTTVMEARPLTITKPECLSCHTEVKKGGAVAIIVYTTTPFVKQGK